MPLAEHQIKMLNELDEAGKAYVEALRLASNAKHRYLRAHTRARNNLPDIISGSLSSAVLEAERKSRDED